MGRPWEQQSNEPLEAYARFLVYRNLGPGRSIDVAYFQSAGAERRSKSQKASGQWYGDSAQYDWPNRALAWDIENLSTIGQSAAIKFIAAVDKFAEKTLAAADKFEPKNWKAIQESLDALSRYIPPETAEAIRALAERDRNRS